MRWIIDNIQSRGFIKCKYAWKRRDSDHEALERFLMLQLTKEGRALVRAATGVKAYRPGAPGTLREWHWKAMVAAWRARPAGVQDENSYYGHIGWNTWLRSASSSIATTGSAIESCIRRWMHLDQIWRRVSRSICYQAQRKEVTMAKRKTKHKTKKIYLSPKEIQAKILRLH